MSIETPVENAPANAPANAAATAGGDLRSDLLGDYLRAGESWESEIHRSLRASRLRAWIVAAASAAVAIVSLMALVFVLPLKEYAPYVVEVDTTTGHLDVMQPLVPGAARPDEAITEANLVRWITARETYDPTDLRARFEEVQRTSAGDARADYRRLWTPDAPTNPAVRYGYDTRIAATIKAVSLLKSDTAAVRYMLTRTDDRTGEVSTSHWVAIVGFRYADTPMRVRDRWTNPLGFEVTSFRADQESIARAPASRDAFAPEAPSGASTAAVTGSAAGAAR